MFGRILLHFLLCIFLNGNILAQQIDADTLVVKTLGQEQGLSQLNALSLDFDHLGYLWVGTENGLNRFNAYEMKTYLAESGVAKLPDDHIRDIYFDEDTLWLATNTHSLIAFPIKGDHFINFDSQLDYDSNPAIKYAHLIYPIDKRYLLLGTYGHCMVYDKKSNEFHKIILPEAAKSDFVTAIESIDSDKFLIGTNQNGIFELDLKKRKINVKQAFSPLLDYKINSFYKYSNDEILIATETFLYIFNGQTQSIQRFLPNVSVLNEIVQIQKWDNAHLYLSTINSGYLLDKNKNLKKLIFKDLQGNRVVEEVTEIKNGPSGGKWIGTNGRGVIYYHPNLRKFKPRRIQATNAPRSNFISIFNFLRDGDKLWMATEFGFARYDFQTDKYKFYPRKFLEYTLAKDANGTLWAGGFGQGLVRYDSVKDDFEKIEMDIDDQEIIQITPIDKDIIWVHTWSNGIYEFNVHTFEVKKKSFGSYMMTRARTSFKDKKGRIWIGNDEGIYRWDGNDIKAFVGLSNNRVFSITEDASGNIWVGTARGLNRIDALTDEVDYYTKVSGLPNDFIYGVEADNAGFIWASTNFGLSRLNPENGEFINFTETDGLQNNEFNGKASYKDEEGNLYFGGMNGFNIFKPEDIFLNQESGSTFIEDVLIFGNSVNKNLKSVDFLSFSSDQNVITFQYTVLNYLWPEKNHYQFKLEGFDKDWRSVTDERSSTYTNLNPGTYLFRVKGSNNEGVWGDEDQLKIIINAPWYKTMWFRVLAGALLICLISGVFIYRNYRQKIINQRLQEMVKQKTQALQLSNRELNRSLELSENQKENIQFLMRELNHRVKNNLQIITSLIDIQDLSIQNPKAKEKLRLLQSRIFTVSRIHDILTNNHEKSNAPIDEFLNELAHEIVEFSGAQLSIKTDLISTDYPVEKLTYLGLILNELIINSVKHAFKAHDTPEISIYLNEEDNHLNFTYRDNGTGFAHDMVQQNDQLGLKLIRFLAEELNGRFETYNDNGAVFKMNFDNKIL